MSIDRPAGARRVPGRRPPAAAQGARPWEIAAGALVAALALTLTSCAGPATPQAAHGGPTSSGLGTFTIVATPGTDAAQTPEDTSPAATGASGAAPTAAGSGAEAAGDSAAGDSASDAEAGPCPTGLVGFWRITARDAELIVCGTGPAPTWGTATVAGREGLQAPVKQVDGPGLLITSTGRIEDYVVYLDFRRNGLLIGGEGEAEEDFRPWSQVTQSAAGREYCARNQVPDPLGTAALADGGQQAAGGAGSTPDGGTGGVSGTAPGPANPAQGDAKAAGSNGPTVAPSDAADLLLPPSRVAGTVAGFHLDPGSSSASWSRYYGSWRLDPAGCAPLETLVIAAPPGFAMSYGTGPQDRDFVKQQVAVLPSRQAATAAFARFRQAARECGSFTRLQDNGRSYHLTASGLRDESAEFPTAALTVHASGFTSWSSALRLVQFGNALVWVNAGTYRSGSTFDSFSLVRADLTAHLRSYWEAHAAG